MTLECNYRAWRECMGNDLALPGVLDAVSNIEDARNTGHKGFVEVTKRVSIPECMI